jgi:hypothetical protein
MFELLFQFQGATLQNTFQQLQSWGFFDVVIPFALIFAILYVLIGSIPFLKDVTKKEGEREKVLESRKNIRATIALAVSLLTVVPHVLGVYPGGIDVVQVINQFLPETALVAVTLFMLMALFSMAGAPNLGKDAEKRSLFESVIPWAAVAIVGFLLLRAISPQTLPFLNNFVLFNDPSFQALIIAVLVFGLVIWLVIGKKD